MKKESFISRSLDDTVKYAQTFAGGICGGDIVTLSGDLGAGKTTFSQSVLAALGATGPFTSPTFTVIRQYDLPQGSFGFEKGVQRVYHIDAYRITDTDMIELGWNEMVADTNAVILVEWPEKITSLIPERATTLLFETISENKRIIKIMGKTL